MAKGQAVATRPQGGAPAAAPAQRDGDGNRGMTIREARGFLQSPAMMEQLAAAAAKAMDPDRLIRVALVAMAKQPVLLTCSQESIALALMESGSLGLAPTGVLGEAYLVPYWNKNKSMNEAQLQIGYRGLVKLARRSGTVFNVVADVVREGDFFEWEKGLTPRLVHRPAQSGSRGPLTYAYATAWVKEGPPPFDVMDAEEIEAIRQRSKAKDSGPWVTDYFEMAKKTVIRRLCKSLDLSADAELAIAHDDDVEYGRGSGQVRLAHSMLGHAHAEVPDSDKLDPSAKSKRLAAQLGAEGNDGPEEGDEEKPPTPSELIRLEQLAGKAVHANLLTMEQASEYELAMHDNYGPGVRRSIIELEKMLGDAGIPLDVQESFA
jgi:recombination protein RecT